MKTILTTAMLLLLTAGCTVHPQTSTNAQHEKKYVMIQSGEASWYSTSCNGEPKQRVELNCKITLLQQPTKHFRLEPVLK